MWIVCTVHLLYTSNLTHQIMHYQMHGWNTLLSMRQKNWSEMMWKKTIIENYYLLISVVHSFRNCIRNFTSLRLHESIWLDVDAFGIIDIISTWQAHIAQFRCTNSACVQLSLKIKNNKPERCMTEAAAAVATNLTEQNRCIWQIEFYVKTLWIYKMSLALALHHHLEMFQFSSITNTPRAFNYLYMR